MSTDTKVKKLIINRMTKSQFDSLPTKNENELYFVEDDDTFLTREELGNVDNTSDLDKPISTATQNALDDKLDKSFYEGVGEAVTTLANLPIAKRSIVANITSASTLSLSGNLKAGQDLYIRVYNNSDGEILLPIPNTGLFVSMSGVSVKIPSRQFIEMSVWCYGESQYSIRVGEIAK